jgi:hypothetical protein
MRRALVVVLLGLASACTERPLGEDSDATSTSTGTTSEPASTAELPTTGATSDASSTTEAEAPPCLELRYSDDAPQTWMLTCGLPELCPGDGPLMFFTSTGDVSDPGVAKVNDLERARCMVAALRDRTFGQLTWWIDVGFVYTASLELLADDAALTRSVDTSELIDPAPLNVREGLHPLRAPGFFADCEDGDATQLYKCLMDSVLPECLPEPLMCPG